MTSPDDDFDEFLRRRRPMFGRDTELEPPLEIDRIVLRRAREAIESEQPHREFRAPSWGMPVALAATLLLVFTVILRVSTPEGTRQPEVTVQSVSRQVEVPADSVAAVPAPAPAAHSPAKPAESPALAARGADGTVVVDLGAVADEPGAIEARAAAQPANRPEKLAEAARAAQPAVSVASTAGETRAEAAPKPEYRRDSKTWLAEIERLRNAGEAARADAELAEYKREHRAYAGAPDR